MKRNQLCMLATILVAIVPISRAGTITAPSGLNLGDKYRIIFETSTTRDAQAGAISNYNTFVTNAANSNPILAALSTSWYALVSTSAVGALTNAGLSAADVIMPFYNTLGQRIAVGTAVPITGLYGGFSTKHTAPILLENGTTASGTRVWTGTAPDGTKPAYLSSCPGCGGSAGTGGSTGAAWTDNAFGVWPVPQVTGGHYYGISGVLTVVPEPGSLGLTVGGSLVCLLLLAKIRP